MSCIRLLNEREKKSFRHFVSIKQKHVHKIHTFFYFISTKHHRCSVLSHKSISHQKSVVQALCPDRKTSFFYFFYFPLVIRSTTTLFRLFSRLYRKVSRAQALVFTPPPSTDVSIQKLLSVVPLVSFLGLFPWWWQIGSLWGWFEDNNSFSVCIWGLVWFLL